ncbi:MAG TPA: trypsin-like peptidase domain-containing protein [Anaerolineae bacterium]|nr:trypsin-like peptidase domain-containing protein [Anaerolineae bacterium]
MTGRALTATALWLLVAVACGPGPALAAETQWLASSTVDTPGVLARVAPAVVTVIGTNAEGEQETLGSGMIVGGDGIVVTAWHVVSQATAVRVKLPSGVSYQADGLLFWDTDWDFAALKISAEDLPTVPLGDSDKVRQGDRVLVVGSPLGLEQTASEGIVSAVRELPSGDKMLQITAAMSPGSSGGPVLNSEGEVVGIACFLLAEGQSLNFAIPINQVKPKLKDAETVTPLTGAGVTGLTGSTEALALLCRGWLTMPEDVNAPDARPKVEAALHLFEAAAEKQPLYALAHFMVGYCHSVLGRPLDAVRAYGCAVIADPEHPVLRGCLGEAYANLGWTDAAVDAYKEAVRLDPGIALIHYKLGCAYFSLGRYVEAVEAHKQAIRLQSDLADAHGGLGAAYTQLGRLHDALQCFKEEIRLTPDSALAHLELATVYLLLGDRGGALDEYKVLKDLDGELAAGLFNILYP